MYKLSDLLVGQSCKVTSFNSEGLIRRRLLDMGITTGVKIKLIKVAPLGDPLEVELRGYNLSIRKAEAQSINIELI